MNKYIDKYGVRSIYILIFAILVAFFVWSTYDYQKTLTQNLLSEARIVARQALAAKTYIHQSQDAINYDSQGGYEFKGVYADAAVRRMGEILSGTTFFTVRQVSMTPRNEENGPDSFEADKLKELSENPGILELYADDSIGGHKVFRYIVPLRADKSCLPCHGSEKGGIDVTGNKKEGYAIGDLIGGLSVIIKTYDKYRLLRTNMSVLLLFIFFLTFTIGLIINSMNNHFKDKLAEAKRMAKPAAPSGAGVSDTFNAKLYDNFSRLVMHNLRNPIGEIIDSPELFRDVPLNILESSLAASNKISNFSSKLIDLKKLEQGKSEVTTHTFDFTSNFKPKLSVYDNAAMVKSVRFTSKSLSQTVKLNTDKKILLKALDNVFLGALKAAKKETGTMHLTVDVNKENNMLELTITNNAERIGAAYENLIFEKFTDIKDINGHLLFNTGIELTLAKFMIGRLGYDLVFDTENKEQNVFIVRIPSVMQG
jgi:signal transduction histidine kinase